LVKNAISIRIPYYESEKIKLKYSNFLKDKRVAIVGPSSLLVGSNQGEYIDSFDVVIRQSRNYFIPDHLQKDMGSRTDVVFSSLNDVYDKGHYGTGIYFPINKMKKKIKWLAMAAPNVGERIKRFKKKINKGRIPVYVVDYDWRLKICEEIGRHTSNGIITLCDTAKYDFRELYITGFTFYKMKDVNGWYYYKEYKPDPTKNKGKKKNRGHDFNAEFDYFKKHIWRSKNNIICDNILERILINEK